MNERSADSGAHLGIFRDALKHSPRRYSRATIVKRVYFARRWLDTVADPWAATVHDVERWAVDLGVSATGTRDAVSHLRQFYRWAIRAGLTVTDPTTTVQLPRVARRLPRPARDRAISSAVADAGPELRAMLALMAGAGLRCCEVARLRWSDVDLLDYTLHVTGKGNRERVMETNGDVAGALAAIDHPGAFVFVSERTGDPYSACRVSQKVNEHLRSVGAGCTAHQLRHRFATRALADCHDITTVRDLLGHSSVSVTEVYAAVTPGAAGKVSRAIGVPGLRPGVL
jgi:site-specific recombinase XerD